MNRQAIVSNIGHFDNEYQVIAQVELFSRTENCPIGVYTLPKHLDEKVARLRLDALGVKLTS